MPFPFSEWWGIALIIVFLLILSGAISGSEVALFSIQKSDLSELRSRSPGLYRMLVYLLRDTDRLLATILIANTFVNVAIVLAVELLLWKLGGEQVFVRLSEDILSTTNLSVSAEVLGKVFNFIVTVIGVTFLLLMFGEITPKLIAQAKNVQFIRYTGWFLRLLTYVFMLFVWMFELMADVASWIFRPFIRTPKPSKRQVVRMVQKSLEHESQYRPAVKLIKGLLRLDDVTARKIMTHRSQVATVDVHDDLDTVLRKVRQYKFSRLPVIDGSFDKIVGILYVKDLLNTLYDRSRKRLKWQKLIVDDVLYVPEQKKGIDLLREFQRERKHIAIVVDEYGVPQGIVTLEDVLEEVVGDIRDEFDPGKERHSNAPRSSKYVDNQGEGSVSTIVDGTESIEELTNKLNLTEEERKRLEEKANIVAGLILEHTGDFPPINTPIRIDERLLAQVIKMRDGRIEQVKVTLLEPNLPDGEGEREQKGSADISEEPTNHPMGHRKSAPFVALDSGDSTTDDILKRSDINIEGGARREGTDADEAEEHPSNSSEKSAGRRQKT